MNKVSKPLYSSSTLCFYAVILAGLLLRLVYLFSYSANVCADEALIGLNSKYIYSLGELPIFIPEQARAGITLGYFSGLLIYLFGPSAFAIKIFPILMSLLYCSGIFLLARKIGNNRFAWYALLLSIFCPAFMTSWIVNGSDQYITCMTLGVYLLLLTLHISQQQDIIHQKKNNRHRLRAFTAECLLGVLTGLSIWVQQLSLTFIIPSMLLMFCTLPIKKLLQKTPLVLFGCLLGLFPLLYFNLSPSARALNGLEGSPNWITFSFLFQAGDHSDGIITSLCQLPSTLINIATISMPMLWGGFEWMFETSFVRKFSYTMVAIVLGGGIFNFIYFRLKTAAFQRRFPFWVWKNNDIPLFSFIIMLLIFSLSRFKYDLIEPRYLFPLYFSITLMVSWSLSGWEDKLKNSGKIALILLIISSITTTILPSTTLDPDHTLWPRDKELTKYLLDNNIKHPIAGFWVAYPLAYDSDEKIWPIPILLERFHYFVLKHKWPINIVEPYYIFPNHRFTKELAEYIFPTDDAPYWDSDDFLNFLQEAGITNQYYNKISFTNYDLFRVSPEKINPLRFVVSPNYLKGQK